MPTFDTPAPITVKLDLIAGDVHLRAGDRADTVVTVRPASDRDVDVRAAERTRVEYADGTLSVQTPKRRGLLGRVSGPHQEGRVQVAVDLPAGSGVRGGAALGRMHGEGRLGECRFSTAAGDIELEQTGPLRLDTALGLVSIGSAIGDVDATTAHGRVRIGPRSVGYLLQQQALVFGGTTPTLTDGAVAAGRVRLGDPGRTGRHRDMLGTALAQADVMLADAIDRMKTSREDCVLVAVGGGSAIICASGCRVS